MSEDKAPGNTLLAAHLVLMAVAILSLGIWTYYLYHYVWTGARQFASGLHIVVYLCLPPLVASLAFVTLRLGPAAKVSLALVCASVGFSIYALELVLILAPPCLVGGEQINTWIDGATEAKKSQVRRLAAELGIAFDTRDSIEVLVEMQTRGIDVVPAVYPRALLQEQQDGRLESIIKIHGVEVLPLGGISNKLTLLCNENGYYTFYQSDERGFHNPKGLWNSEQLDVAILGDSFAQGFCVPSDKNFMALIRRRYPATLTLGMGGNGPLLELATLKEFLPALKPRVVLWAYFGKNDLNELRNEVRSPLLLRYLKSDQRQGLASLQAQIDQALMGYVATEKSKALRRQEARKNRTPYIKEMVEFAKLRMLRSRLGLVPDRNATGMPGTAAEQALVLSLFRAVLLQAKATVATWGGILYFIYLPEWERYAAPELVRQNREQVLQVATDLDIPIIDIHDAFQSHPDVLSLFPLRRSGHYNIEGNALLAETVLKHLSQ